MDTIFYGPKNASGQGLIKLTVIQSMLWEREPMFDASGTTYQDTRWRGSVIASYNPGATSYAGSPPAAQAGQFPPQTDVAIRRYLEEPRGYLSVFSLGNKVIESPIQGFTCDTRNGPFVKDQP